MKSTTVSSLIFTFLLSLPVISDAVELGEFCWNATYFDATSSWNMQVTQHGSYFAVNGKSYSGNGVWYDEGAIMGSGYATGGEVRLALVEVAITPPYDVNDMYMDSGAFVVNLTDFSATYHFIEEDTDYCLPDPAPCAKSIPATPVACP
jgi:hypothetical protein